MTWVRGVRLVMVSIVVSCGGDARAPGHGAAGAEEALAWPAFDEATLAAALATQGHALGVPEPLAIAPDGAVLFRRSDARDPVADLFQLAQTGFAAPLASARALLGGTPAPGVAPRGIESIDLSRDGAQVMVPLAGRLFLIERATGAARELALGPHREPQLSPDGKQVAFVRDGDLWVAPIGDKTAAAAVRIAQHGPEHTFGEAEAGAARLGRRRGFWWSPDSQAILFQRTDARARTTVYARDLSHPRTPPTEHPVTSPAQALPAVDLGVISTRGGAPRWVTWDAARYPHLVRVHWPARGALTVVVADRAQRELAALAVDPATGATRPLVTDATPAWGDDAPDPLTWLEDGSGFLWLTEAGGARVLDRYRADGTRAGRVIEPDVGLRRVVGLVPGGAELVIEATTDPRELHVLRAPLAGGKPWALTKGGGVHRALTAYDVVAVRSGLHGGGRVGAATAGTRPRVELPLSAEPPRQLPTTKLDKLKLERGEVHVAITRPHALDAHARYPVLMALEVEPGESAVRDVLDDYLGDQWWADAGFIVVRADARGTPAHQTAWRSARGADRLTLLLDEHVAALRAICAAHTELDCRRVAALGTGVGGYLATLAAARHPALFAAAVARSPIADWALADAALAARYVRPAATAEAAVGGPDLASAAAALSRPLLVVQQAGGDGREAAHVARLVDGLSATGRWVQLAVLPVAQDAASELARAKIELTFLRDHLGPARRPVGAPASPAPAKPPAKQPAKPPSKTKTTGAGAAKGARG